MLTKLVDCMDADLGHDHLPLQHAVMGDNICTCIAIKLIIGENQ